MPEIYAHLLSDHLMDALHALEKATKAVSEEKIVRREAVVHELVQAKLSISRVVGLIAGAPQ